VQKQPGFAGENGVSAFGRSGYSRKKGELELTIRVTQTSNDQLWQNFHTSEFSGIANQGAGNNLQQTLGAYVGMEVVADIGGSYVGQKDNDLRWENGGKTFVSRFEDERPECPKEVQEGEWTVWLAHAMTGGNTFTYAKYIVKWSYECEERGTGFDYESDDGNCCALKSRSFSMEQAQVIDDPSDYSFGFLPDDQ